MNVLKKLFISGCVFAGTTGTVFAQSSNGQAAAAAGIAGFFLLIGLALALVMVISMWKVFSKAGQPGWAAIVPISELLIWRK